MDRIEHTVPLLQCNGCRGNELVCGAVTYQRLLYSCLFRGHCLAERLHVITFAKKEKEGDVEDKKGYKSKE
jgi:hypothetical protein